jgi:pimeloyl-ACP methyl ester carboxylesterase
MTPLLLIPGMMCDGRLFGPQIAAFSAQRTIIVAQIGACDRVEALAASVLADAPARFALAGLSMGGMIAMEMLRQAPDRIERLALLDTNPLAEADDVKAQRDLQMATVRAGGLADLMRQDLIPRYLAEGPGSDAIAALCYEMAMAMGAGVFKNQSRALQTRPDQQDTLRGYAAPALVLCGRQDGLAPVARHQLMAQLITGATLQIVEGAGHLPTLEQPAQTNHHFARWLSA